MKFISQNDSDKIKSLREGGIKIAVIARSVSRTPLFVRKHCAKYGIHILSAKEKLMNEYAVVISGNSYTPPSKKYIELTEERINPGHSYKEILKNKGLRLTKDGGFKRIP